MEEELDLSIAQVEAELRAAEAYLTTASNAQTVEPNGYASSSIERVRAPRDDSESTFLNRTSRARPPISSDRRKEILARLSSERQTAIRNTTAISSSPASSVSYSHSRQQEARRASPPYSTGLVQTTPDYYQENGADEESDPLNQTQLYGHSRAAYGSEDEDEDEEKEEDDVDDGGEVFYASDIVGQPVHVDVKPRTALDLFASGQDHFTEEDDDSERDDDDEDGGNSYTGSECDADEMQQTIPTNYRRTTNTSNEGDAVTTPDQVGAASGSIFSKILTRQYDQYGGSDMDISRLLEATIGEGTGRTDADQLNSHAQHSSMPIDTNETVRVVPTEDHYENIAWLNDQSGDQQSLLPHHKRASEVKPKSRLDRLADPRTHVFADREKQRLIREMDELKECTFRPSVLQPQADARHRPRARSVSPKRERAVKSVRFAAGATAADGVFPWLTLSPRRRTTTKSNRQSSQSLIERLHLDGTAKYEARERLREMLEAERFRECTFQPQINSFSRKLISKSEYRPIHERVGELQREKIEYIQRIREEIAYEDEGYTFTPEINPRSREIADTVIHEKLLTKLRSNPRRIDLSDDDQVQAMLRPPRVTQRLVEDAEKIAEKRVAVQEYYDALEEKSYAPKISETSTKIVEQRPEFKLDFLSRQEYFQMVEQERLEALEDIVHHEQEMTFKPNIGNADRLLREMRPDLANESTQQRLQRLIYYEPRKTELRKQKMRQDAHAQHTFKPKINPISQALAEKAKAEVATRATRRHELQRYFEGKRFRSRVAKEQEQAEKAECTFRPQLIARPKTKSSSTSKLVVKERQQDGQSLWRSDNILHMIETQRQQRSEDLEAKRNALELKELENCTFQPNAHRSSQRRTQPTSAKSAEKPVVVRGLDRFLELKDRAKRQQEELKQREEKVFHPHRSYEPRSYTIPKPFKLSEASKDTIRRRLQVKADMRNKERNECTFAPQTIEAQQRKVLRAMLKD